MNHPTISLHQPWASLCVIRQPHDFNRCHCDQWGRCLVDCPTSNMPMIKRFETRSWPCPPKLIGSRILIHASQRKPHVVPGWTTYQYGLDWFLRQKTDFGMGLSTHVPLPLGAIVGSATPADCFKIGHFLPEAQTDLANGIERRPIPGYPGYVVDFEGRVWPLNPSGRNPSAAALTPSPSRTNYPAYTLYVDGRKISRIDAHKLSALAWLGPRPDGAEIRHVDHGRDNPAPWNLRYGTRAENGRDTAVNGNNRHERHPLAKLSERQVADIRQWLAMGTEQRVLARKYGVAQGTISFINSGTTWAAPPPPVDDSLAESRYAWLLTDAAPTTERCPACNGEDGSRTHPAAPDGSLSGCPRCTPTGGCGGIGRCDPIPARGRQRIWNWTPT